MHKRLHVRLVTFLSINYPPTTEIYTLSLHDALPIFRLAGVQARALKRDRRLPRAGQRGHRRRADEPRRFGSPGPGEGSHGRSEEHTSELQSRGHLVCRLLLEKKKIQKNTYDITYESP